MALVTPAASSSTATGHNLVAIFMANGVVPSVRPEGTGGFEPSGESGQANSVWS